MSSTRHRVMTDSGAVANDIGGTKERIARRIHALGLAIANLHRHQPDTPTAEFRRRLIDLDHLAEAIRSDMTRTPGLNSRSWHPFGEFVGHCHELQRLASGSVASVPLRQERSTLPKGPGRRLPQSQSGPADPTYYDNPLTSK